MTEADHFDLYALADYAEGILDEAEAAVVRAHLPACGECRRRAGELADVSRQLAEAPSAPSMPASVAERIDSALAEAARERDVVPISRARRRRTMWLSGIAASLAAVVFGGVVGVQALQGGGAPGDGAGGGESAERMHDGAGSARAQEGTRARSGDAAQAAASVTASGREYSARRLSDQVDRLLRERDEPRLRAQGVQPTPRRLESLGAPGRLARCITRVTGPDGEHVLAVDLARYAGKPSAVIVASERGPRQADIWVVDPSCSHIREHQRVTGNR